MYKQKNIYLANIIAKKGLCIMFKKGFASILSGVTSEIAKGTSKVNSVVSNYASEVSKKKKYDFIVYEEELIKGDPEAFNFLLLLTNEELSFENFITRISAFGKEHYSKRAGIMITKNNKDAEEIAAELRIKVVSPEEFYLMMKKDKMLKDASGYVSQVGNVLKDKFGSVNNYTKQFMEFLRAAKKALNSNVKEAYKMTDDPYGYAQYISLTIGVALAKSGLFNEELSKSLKKGFLDDDGVCKLSEKIDEFWELKDIITDKELYKEIIPSLKEYFFELIGVEPNDLDEVDIVYDDDNCELSNDTENLEEPSEHIDMDLVVNSRDFNKIVLIPHVDGYIAKKILDRSEDSNFKSFQEFVAFLRDGHYWFDVNRINENNLYDSIINDIKNYLMQVQINDELAKTEVPADYSIEEDDIDLTLINKRIELDLPGLSCKRIIRLGNYYSSTGRIFVNFADLVFFLGMDRLEAYRLREDLWQKQEKLILEYLNNCLDEHILIEFPGIGDAKARTIVEYNRMESHEFETFEQFVNVIGIQKKYVKSLRAKVFEKALEQL